MKIDLSQPIQIDPSNKGNTTTAKEVAQQALFGAPQQVISKELAKQLYDKIEASEAGIVEIPSEDVGKIKAAVDAGFIRGVSWQFSDIVEGKSEKE